MSCLSSANRNKVAALRCGLSSTASKAAYAAAGAALGGTLGGAAGAVVSWPAGAVVGASVGASLLARAGWQKRTAAIEENRWLASPAGQKAVQKRDRQLDALDFRYRKQTNLLKTQRDKVKAEYQDAQAAGLAAMQADEGSTKPVGIVAAKAVGAAAKTAAMAALVARPRPGRDTKGVAATAAGVELLRQAGQFKEQVRQERIEAWSKTKTGRAVQEKYQQQRRQWKIKAASVRRDYQTQRDAILGDYNRQRTAFLQGMK